MPGAASQGNPRKTLAVKHQDGEPLTRVDLQFDLLYHLFSDTRAAFTDPYTTIRGDPAGTKVNFRDLYVNTLLHSPRCSKVSRDKLLQNPEFADEFAKISLLSNIGRINTTMAFFPEMRTALRTYHPVPALQKTDGNLQDAPRVKNILKSCLLSTELQNTPVTPTDVLARSRSGEVPPTTIVNLIFIFASHSTMMAQAHFPPHSNFDLSDFFSPINVSSESRARAFLWLCYHYHESPLPNPFDDEYSRRHPGQVPTLESLSPEEAKLENMDTPEEKEWGLRMKEQRRIFMENKDKSAQTDTDQPKEKTSRRRRKDRAPKSIASQKRPSAGTSKLLTERSPVDMASSSTSNLNQDQLSEVTMSHLRLLCDSHQSPPILPSMSSSSPEASYEPSSHTRASGRPDHHFPSPFPTSLNSNDRRVEWNQSGKPRGPTLPPLKYVASYSEESLPRELPPLSIPPSPPMLVDSQGTPPTFCMPPDATPASSVSFHSQSRTMLEQAWHVVMTTDPLEDSEDERDENTRLDLSLRLRIINRLRGKEPTPEPENFRNR